MAAFQRRYYAGGGTTTTLANPMGTADTTFNVVSSTGWPGSPGVDFLVVIDRGTASEEKILCTSESGITVTVASGGRGYDGTSAIAHNSGAPVSLCAAAIDFDEANQVTNLVGNGAEGSLFYGKGTGVLPAPLTIGADGTILSSNGTDPTWSTLTALSIPTLTSTSTLTNKRITKRVLALSANSATPAINTDNYDVVHITAQTAAITGFTMTGTPVDSDTLRISITGTAAVAITWGASFEASTVALPTTTTGTNRLDVGFFWNSETSKWRCVALA